MHLLLLLSIVPVDLRAFKLTPNWPSSTPCCVLNGRQAQFTGAVMYLLQITLFLSSDFVCISSRCKGEMSSKTKEMYIITEMNELSENDRPKESSFIQPRASSIQSKKDEAANEQQTDLDVDILAPIPVPSVEGWLQFCKYLQFVEALFLDPVSGLFKTNQETTLAV